MSPDDSAPLRTAALNVELLLFLVLFAALTIVAWRRFGAPYGLFAALSLAMPLSAPSSRWPLLSLPRFGLTIFPLFLALAWLGRTPRAHAAILGSSAILLGVFVTQWALWDWSREHRAAEDDRRLAGWVAFIAVIAAIQYTAPKPPKNILYHWTTRSAARLSTPSSSGSSC